MFKHYFAYLDYVCSCNVIYVGIKKGEIREIKINTGRDGLNINGGIDIAFILISDAIIKSYAYVAAMENIVRKLLIPLDAILVKPGHILKVVEYTLV